MVLGELNAKVSEVRMEGIIGGWGLSGIKDNGRRQVELCADKGHVIGNIYFRKKDITNIQGTAEHQEIYHLLIMYW